MAVFFLTSVPSGVVGVAACEGERGVVLEVPLPVGFRIAAAMGVCVGAADRSTAGRVGEEVEEEEEEEEVGEVGAAEGEDDEPEGGSTFFFFLMTFLINFLDSSPADETDAVGEGEVAAGVRNGAVEEGTLALVIARRGSTSTTPAPTTVGDIQTAGATEREANEASVDFPFRMGEATGEHKENTPSALAATTAVAAADTQRRLALLWSTRRERIFFFF